MTRCGRQGLRGVLLAAALWPATAAAQPDWTRFPAHISPCEMTSLDAGRPEARWALGEGVYADERDRSGRHHVWTPRLWTARLLLADVGERTLRLTGRRGPPALEIRAFWNDVDLGLQEATDPQTTVVWTVPARATRAGLNRLRFEASDARTMARELSFRLDRLEIEPAGRECGPVETARATDAFRLAPGAVLYVGTDLPPAARLELEITGEPGGTLELYQSRDGGRQQRSEMSAGGDRRREVLELGSGLSNELAIVSRSDTLTTVRLVGVSGDLSSRAWRGACGLWWQELLLGAALLSLLAACLTVGGRWPGSRGVRWLDGALLFALALGLRLAFLEAYPRIDAGRFGDSWEYLQRARYLFRNAEFWSDTSWHAWQTWIRPPGYYLFLNLVRGNLGGELMVIARVQAILLAGVPVAAYLAASPLFGRGAALAAGLLVTVYPQTITSAAWILSDPLSLLLTTAALACVSWLTVRPRWPLALAAGTLFGLACLVRSAPLYYVPLAGLLLYLGARKPRLKTPAITFVGVTLLVVLPWCVRNSLIYGKPMGIDDLVVPNFLMAHPDPEIMPPELEESGVYGEADEARERYFGQLWRANKAARLTLDSGRILGRGLVRMATHPGTTLRRFGLHLKIYFQGFPRFYAEHFLDEHRGCRVTWWTDAANGIYFPTLALCIAGVVFAWRDPRSWPLIAWILFFVLVTNLFFYPSYMPGRYRLPIYPVMAVFAGLSLSRLGQVLGTRLGRLWRPPAGA